MIITISRQCGAGGNKIGELLSKEYNIKFYNKYSIITIAKKNGLFGRMPFFFSENPAISAVQAIIEGSGAENANIPAEGIQKTIGTDSSYVIVGRCGNNVFKDEKNSCRIFLYGDIEDRISNISSSGNAGYEEAKKTIDITDERRSQYHQHYTKESWGEAKHYDLSLNSNKLGIDKTVKIIKEYIKIMGLK